MNLKKINALVIVSLLSALSLHANLRITDTTKQSLEEQKACFHKAKQQLENMLSGKEPLNYEKAVFVTENAYYGNTFQFIDFQKEIDLYQRLVELHCTANHIKKITDFKTTLLESAESKYQKYLLNLKNYAIYTLIADTMTFKDQTETYTSRPFTYARHDPFSTNDWTTSQVLHLLTDTNGVGNCYALASFYKILSERLHTQAQLATVPNHIYIVHKDVNDVTYNIELGSKAFPGNGSIETITFTTDKALKSHIAMRYLDLKQSIALNLVYLAKSYQYKFKTNTDEFLMDCATTTLLYDSLNLNAMLLKAEVSEERLFQGLAEKNIVTPSQLSKYPELSKSFKDYEKQIAALYDLGYLEMPVEMKNILISTYLQDNYPLIHQDHTPSAYSSFGKRHDNDNYVTLSHGLFDEVHLTKATEKYSRVILDTKTKKIIAFAIKDTTYNNYDFDPVLFAWQIDPLTSKYPYYSPYSAFGNNPILYVDNDGRENIIYLVYLPSKDSKITLQDARDMANQANTNYEKLGLKTRVVVVDKSITGGKEFDPSKTDKTDAVAVIGTVASVKKYINKHENNESGYLTSLSGWQGGTTEPEISENHVGGQDGDNSKGGGDFIAIDGNAVESFGKIFGYTKAQSGGFIINHGSGHNSDNTMKLDHPYGGIMTKGQDMYDNINEFKDYNKVIGNTPSSTSKPAGRNQSLINAVRTRFGTNTAKVSYPKN